MTPEQIATLKQELRHFTGSDSFYKHRLSSYIYTEGAKHVATQLGAYWLLDFVFIHQTEPVFTLEEFQVWDLSVREDHTATIRVEDGNKNELKVFTLPFTDFALSEFTLWFVNGTLMLPSEY